VFFRCVNIPMTAERINTAVAAAAQVAEAAVSAPSAPARTNVDPCGSDAAPRVTGDGVHCGRIFEIPAGATLDPPHRDTPPTCNPANRMIIAVDASAGYQYASGDFQSVNRSGKDRRGEQGQVEIGVEAIGGAWDYWAEGGDVQWTGNSTATSGHRHQPIDVHPSFHNWGSERSRVRVFFRCTTIP
jgi:hypothetical protein